MIPHVSDAHLTRSIPQKTVLKTEDTESYKMEHKY